MTKITNSEKETFNLAQKFAKELKGGEIIGLTGDLGAGKTVFTKGLAKGLGIKNTITSPTFVIMKIYKTKNNKAKINNLCHIDAYRVTSGNDIIAIGAEEYLEDKNSVSVIEWADRIKKILPKNTIYIKLSHLKNDERKIIFANKKGVG